MTKKLRQPGRDRYEAEPGLGWRPRLLRLTVVCSHVVVWAALLSILLQLLYPGDRALPYMSVDGQPVGMLTEEALLEKLDGMALDAELTVVTPAKTRTVQWATVGATIDRLATSEVVLGYAWWERLVPFSSLARMAQPGHTPLVIIDQERLDAFAGQIAAEGQRSAQEASITIKDGEVRVDPAKAGYVFEVDDIKQQLLAVPFSAEAKLTLEPQTVPAAHSAREVAAVADQLRQLLRQDIRLSFAGQTLAPEPKIMGAWLKVTEDKQTKQLRPAIDKAALKKYLEHLNEQYAAPPEPVVVTLLDGREIKRTASEPGLAMNMDEAAGTISRAVLNPAADAAITVPVVPVAPDVLYRRTYSQSSEGLNALIRYWEATTYGNYGIIVREIGGQNRYAEFGADKRFVTASTYKMFLAYTVFKKIEAGKITPSQTTDMGWTVEDCITEMIVNSTNPCAVSLQNLVGWKEVDRMLHQAGFTDTYLNNLHGDEDKYTTVRDEADFLLRLYGGSLMNQAHTNQLLGLMQRQIWRGGIPAGVPYGTTVANKVGFYDGWIHDVAIVYGPKSTYILAIMSRGGSDPGFAELSRQVYDFFNR